VQPCSAAGSCMLCMTADVKPDTGPLWIEDSSGDLCRRRRPLHPDCAVCRGAHAKEAVQYYAAFTAYAHGSGGRCAASAARSAVWRSASWRRQVLLLRQQTQRLHDGTDHPCSVPYVTSCGPRSTCRSKTSFSPPSASAWLPAVVEPPDEDLADGGASPAAHLSASEAADTAAPAEISWEIDLSAAAEEAGDAEDASAQTALQPPEGISWDVDISSADAASASPPEHGQDSAAAPAAVDWDVQLDSAGAGGGADAAPETAAIDWDFTMDDAGTGEEAVSGHAADGLGVAASGDAGHDAHPAADPLLAALMDSSDARARSGRLPCVRPLD
jgi:hypothetical protein